MRVKTGPTRHRRHQRVLTRTKGMRMSKGTLYKVSKEADLHAGQYAYVGRKLRKRDLRRLWIQRINAALSQLDQPIKYSRFLNGLKAAHIQLDRKTLADLATTDIAAFSQIAKQVQSQ